ncbi:hypothetical protein BH20ACI1_BH20ACI1_06360 [soil metagenome]
MENLEQKILEKICTLTDEEQLKVLEFVKNLLKEYESEIEKEGKNL